MVLIGRGLPVVANDDVSDECGYGDKEMSGAGDPVTRLLALCEVGGVLSSVPELRFHRVRAKGFEPLTAGV